MGPEIYTIVSTCDQMHVPLISMATNPYFSAESSSIFIRATLNYSSESLPITNLTKYFNWTSICTVYEEYRLNILQSFDPNLADVKIGSYLIPWNPSDSQIEDALQLMMASTTRVFLVHVVSPQAVRIFQLADKLGMMSKGYVWIVTSSVGDILDTLQSATLSSMNGVVGFRTTEQSGRERLMDFSKRYKARLQKDNPTIYQLWEYDAAWAVAMAVEKTKISDPSFAVPPLNGSLENLTNNIRSTSFSNGLAGNFGLVNGQRQFSTYEIVNVVDNVTRVIGFWTQQYGISESKNSTAGSNYTLNATWPGNLTKPPKSETYSPMALQIGIPVKNESVGEFSMSVFIAARDLLPKQLNYTTVLVDSTSNVSSLFINMRQLDGIVGDIIIPEDDTEAYFTRPYMEGGVQMVVRLNQDTSGMGMWMFLRPFTLNLWLIIIAFFVFTGLAIWVTEHRVNPNYGADGSSRVEHSFIKQLGNTFYSAFSTVVYAHDRSVQSTLSRVLLIIWLFVVFVLAASYQASLSAILTVAKLKPAVNSLDDLIESGGFVGYQEGSSIMYDLLTKTFSFSESQIRSLRTDQYAIALNNGWVSAIFEVGPYITVFLNQSQNRCNFTIVGPAYQSKRFGFVRLFIITGVVSGLMVIISLTMYVHKNKNHLKNTLRNNNITFRDRISALWKNFLSSESSEVSIVGTNPELPQSETELVHSTNQGPRTDLPEGASPVEIEEIKKGR